MLTAVYLAFVIAHGVMLYGLWKAITRLLDWSAQFGRWGFLAYLVPSALVAVPTLWVAVAGLIVVWGRVS